MRFSRPSLSVALWLLAISKLAVAGQYQVTLDQSAREIRVEACFERLPQALSSGDRHSADFLKKTTLQHAHLSSNHTRLFIQGAPCLQYSIDLEQVKEARQARSENDAWVINNRSWLWRPDDNREVVLTFHDNTGRAIEVSTPWPARTLNGQTRYLAGNTPLGWTSRMAFGNVHILPTQVADQQLNIAFVGIDNRERQHALQGWIAEAAGAVANLYGRYPIDQVQVLLIPIGQRSEAVPWAEVQRAGNPSVHLFIDASRPIAQFREDWSAVHEFSHLLHPRVEYRDRWISEGLASYYQHVSKARFGMFSPEQGWQKLRAGFARGRKVASGALRTSRQTRHLYWGGAAIFLLADIRLRELPEPQTLDEVLEKLQACCLPSHQLWSADVLMQRLDAISHSSIFSELLANEATAKQFPVDLAFEQEPDPALRKHMKAIFAPRLRLAQKTRFEAEED